jgi:hypothetical protein
MLGTIFMLNLFENGRFGRRRTSPLYSKDVGTSVGVWSAKKGSLGENSAPIHRGFPLDSTIVPRLASLE